MPVITPVRFVVATSGIVLATAAGAIVAAASLAQVASVDAVRPPSATQQAIQSAPQPGQVATPRGVSFGFAEFQPGSPVKLISVTSNTDQMFSSIRIRNDSEHPLAAVTFLAVVERRPGAGPAILIPSAAIPVTLAPGEIGEVETEFLRIDELLDWQRTRNAGKLAFLGVVRVSFADGDAWEIKPLAGAITEVDVFHLGTPILTRASLSDPALPGTSAKYCLDERGLKFSEGAMVKLRGEEAIARCSAGRWIAQK